MASPAGLGQPVSHRREVLVRYVRVYSNPFLPNARLVQDHLKRAGVPAQMRNDQLTGTMGLVPFTDVFAEVHVPEDRFAEADRIVRDLMGTDERGRLSTGDDRDGALSVAQSPCGACGAEREPGFDVCWQCGAELD